MDPCSSFIPLKARHRRRPRKAATAPPTPAALTLVAASYVPAPPALTLVFDRAVDIDAFNGAAILLDDGVEQGLIYTGGEPAELLGPAVVKINLLNLDPSSGSQVLLSATAASGIVAATPPVGGTWAGVTGLELPFP